jgi:hypothetical protein
VEEHCGTAIDESEAVDGGDDRGCEKWLASNAMSLQYGEGTKCGRAW